MRTYADRRTARRIIVGPEFGISFTLKGHAHQEVRITNLSAQGCFALLRPEKARLFERGAVLEHLVLLHPDLPKSPILAGVSYVLDSRSTTDALDMVGVGIQFLGMDDSASEALAAWVEATGAEQR
jgi:hypothetical protein